MLDYRSARRELTRWRLASGVRNFVYKVNALSTMSDSTRLLITKTYSRNLRYGVEDSPQYFDKTNPVTGGWLVEKFLKNPTKL